MKGCLYAVGIIIIGIVIIGIFGVIMSNNDTESTPLTKEEKRKKEISKLLSSWDGSHRGLVKKVKRQLHDSKSFEHVETRYIDNGDSISLIMKYRAKNLFGAKKLEIATGKIDNQGNLLE